MGYAAAELVDTRLQKWSLDVSCSRRVWRVMVKYGTRAQQFPKRRANTTYSDIGERGNPTGIHNLAGRYKQTGASPRIVMNAGGRIVVQRHGGELHVVEEGGNEAA